VRLTLLGPQRRAAGVRAAVAEILPDGPVAAVNAGWPEREGETGELDEVVAFPHARRRLRLDDHPRMAVLARRLAPYRAVLLPDGARLDLQHGGLPRQALQLDPAGRVAGAAAAG
jgi:hypothetical protein